MNRRYDIGARAGPEVKHEELREESKQNKQVDEYIPSFEQTSIKNYQLNESTFLFLVHQLRGLEGKPTASRFQARVHQVVVKPRNLLRRSNACRKSASRPDPALPWPLRRDSLQYGRDYANARDMAPFAGPSVLSNMHGTTIEPSSLVQEGEAFDKKSQPSNLNMSRSHILCGGSGK